MDRIYVKHQNKVPVHQLGLDLWRDTVVRQPVIRNRMIRGLLDLVGKERSGEIIDRALVRSITTVSFSVFNGNCVWAVHDVRHNFSSLLFGLVE